MSIWTPEEREMWAWTRYSTLVEWAEDTLVLPPRDPEPGPWRVSRTPYLKSILEAESKPWVEQVTLKAGRQIGKTMWHLIKGCYRIDQHPTRALYLMGREEDAATIAEERFKPLIEASPKLARYITSPRSIQKDSIRLNGTLLKFATANSAAALCSTPWENVDCDETHLYKFDVGSEGNPIQIVRKSMENYAMRSLGMVSSCTDSFSIIHLEYLNGTQGRWSCRCPHCGGVFHYKFAQIKVPAKMRDAQRIRAEKLAWYECEFCKGIISEQDKPRLLQEGFYVYGNRTVERPTHESFWVGGIDSPWRTFSGVIAEFFECGNDAAKLRAFYNTTLGEEFDEKIEQIEFSEVDKWVLPDTLPQGKLPPETQLVTGQVDWHGEKKGFYWMTWAWAKCQVDEDNPYPFRAWLVDFGQVYSRAELEERFFQVHWHVGNTRFPLRGGVDSGWETEEVYQFVRPKYPLFRPTKGESQERTGAACHDSPIEYTGKGGKVYKGFSRLMIQTGYYKDAFSRYMQIEPAKCPFRFCQGTTQEVFDHLQSEVKKKVKGKDVWVPRWEGIPNHFFDCLIGSWANAEYWGLLRMQPRPVQQAAAESVAVPRETGFGEEQETRQSSWLHKRQGGWLRR